MAFAITEAELRLHNRFRLCIFSLEFIMKAWFMKNKWKVIISLLIVAALTAAFFAGGSPQGSTPSSTAVASESRPESVSSQPVSEPAERTEPSAPSESSEPSEISSEPEETEPEPTYVPPAPIQTQPETEPETEPEAEPALSCTISITCYTILDNFDLCKPEKQPFVPADGVILSTRTVEFEEGESVFDVLQRVCRDYGIQLDASWTPTFNSSYVKSIANLYEKDVTSNSGWLYKVNGWFPNYGCSSYYLEDGDSICWVYTCDLGQDVGVGF